MSEHVAMISWTRGDQDFASGRYSRAHEWRFDGGAAVPASPSPQIVPPPMSDPAAVDPEEAFVAALASCHMLFFLSLAAKAGWTAESYEDSAIGEMGRNADGRTAIVRVRLWPKIAWAEPAPDSAEIDRLHHAAHEMCFLANSVNAEIVVDSEDDR